MVTNYPNGLQSQGVLFPGVTGGNIYFADLEDGKAGNDGTSVVRPVSTVDLAVDKARAGNDDIISLMGSGAVTSATGPDGANPANSGVTLDKEGIKLVGLPDLNSPLGARPRITGTDTDCIEIAESKISIQGIRIGCVESAYAGGNPMCGIKVTGARYQLCLRNIQIQLDAPTGDHGNTGVGIAGSVNNSLIEQIHIRGVHTANTGILTFAGQGSTARNIMRDVYMTGLMTMGYKNGDSTDDTHEKFHFGPGLATGYEIVGATSTMSNYYTAATLAESVSGTSKNGDEHALS